MSVDIVHQIPLLTSFYYKKQQYLLSFDYLYPFKAASEDEGRIKELKKQLAQVESELNQKDNDTYRKQNASIL